MFRTVRVLTICIGAIVLVPTSLAAESHAAKGVVYLNNVPVLELKSGDAATRAGQMAKSLRSVDDDSEVHTKQVGSLWKVVVGASAALMVDADEAEQHRTTAQRLADLWASQIRDALALPPLKFSVDALRVPTGTVTTIGLVGSLAYNADVTSTNEAVLAVRKQASGIDVRCVAAGDAQIKAVYGNSMRTLNVSVRPNAGSFPQEFVAEVTGDPAIGSTVTGAVEACVKTRLVSLPTATYSYVPVQADALGPGKSKSYTVRVRLKAPDAFDNVGNVTVTVRNLSIPNVADTALWYSNAPESVRQIGPLFSSALKRNAPVRFLYHHVNASTLPMIIRAEAVNDTDEAARVLVTPGDTKPDLNPVRAGMTATVQFFRSLRTDSGEVVILPPHSTFPISLRRISPKETMSGLCSLRLLDGPSEVQVRTDALPPFDLQGSWYNASLSSTPWREIGTHPINDYDRALSEPSQHVYPNPYKDEKLNYTVGGRYGFLLLGQRPISGEGHTNNLDGNFGVIYRIKAKLQNPTETATDVDLVFEASAGYMGGIFLLDGNLIQTPLLNPKSETRIARFHLPTGASKTVELVTVPVSGGSYPATLFLRPVEVVASTRRGGELEHRK